MCRLFRGDAKRVSKAERFFIVVAAVQTDARRVCTNFIFMLEFRDKLDEVATDARRLSTACLEVQQSIGLKALLLKARDLGNLVSLYIYIYIYYIILQ